MHSNGSLWKLFAREIIKQQTTNTTKIGKNDGNGITSANKLLQETPHKQLSLNHGNYNNGN